MVCVKWGNDCDLNSISTQLEKIVSFSHAKKKIKEKIRNGISVLLLVSSVIPVCVNSS